jgi:hypothetical protein
MIEEWKEWQGWMKNNTDVRMIVGDAKGFGG